MEPRRQPGRRWSSRRRWYPSTDCSLTRAGGSAQPEARRVWSNAPRLAADCSVLVVHHAELASSGGHAQNHLFRDVFSPVRKRKNFDDDFGGSRQVFSCGSLPSALRDQPDIYRANIVFGNCTEGHFNPDFPARSRSQLEQVCDSVL